ncbi:hypothetical protein BV898_11757 [Hypsibius exemplaris]|uniref:Uncharacterized protein n=1 Tax=Hypsibius exemplaris TaxID=2072580 RepID=A0A1W0WFJ3_HYPEX|nr:hypothetical protein BV898_11757 [Hypsibius exemplaris]
MDYGLIRKKYFPCLCLSLWLSFIGATNRYYQTYLSYGSGDTMIQIIHTQGGSLLPHNKWNVECLDGEAMVGINDSFDDYIRLQSAWCKFMFPLKPPTNGLYPYYPRCHVRNATDQYHCYVPTQHNVTSDTFITAMHTHHPFSWIHRIPQDNLVPFKCCKTPLGYYIDYVSCYYQPTHDPNFEYYDSPFQFIVYCAQGHVMTGLSKKVNPYTAEHRYDWIQCCRVGVGLAPRRAAHPPPVTYMPSGVPTYRARGDLIGIPAEYSSQYRTFRDAQASDQDQADDQGRESGTQTDIHSHRWESTVERNYWKDEKLRRTNREKLLASRTLIKGRESSFWPTVQNQR